MKTLLIIALCVVASNAFAQNPVMSQLMDTYGGKPGFTTVNVSKKMFSLFSKVANEEEQKAFKEVIGNLNAIQILNADSTVAAGFSKQIMSNFKPKGYEELLTVRENGKRVEIVMKENGDIIEELLIIAIEDKEASLISITGRINLKQISQLSKQLNINGLEDLERLNKKK